MTSTRDYEVEVTGLKFSKPFFKVFARKISDKFSMDNLKRIYMESAKNGFPSENGLVCLAKIDHNSYERCRILQIHSFEERATVILTDCGINAKMPLSKLRILQNQRDLIAGGKKYREFFLAGIKVRDEIASSSEEVKKEILRLHDDLVKNSGKRFIMRIVAATEDGIQIADFHTERNWEKTFADNFLHRGSSYSKFMEKVHLQNQINMLRTIRNNSANQTQVRFELPTDDSEDSPKDKKKNVSITENHGVKSFYVRTSDANNDFHEMQCWLNQPNAIHEPFRFFPLPQIGQRCLVVEDGRNFRGAFESVTLNEKFEYRIILIDTGKKIEITDKAQQSQIKRLPKNFEGFPPLAKQFQLADMDRVEDTQWETENDEKKLNFIFHMLTKGQYLQLEIEDNANTSECVIPKCVLYLNGVNLNEKIRNYNLHEIELAEQKMLDRSQKYKIKCTYVESPKHFSVQLVDQQPQIDSLQEKLSSFQSPCVPDVLINDLVIVKIMNKKMRCLVKSQMSKSNTFRVFAVDYGFNEDTSPREMYLISEGLAALPPMAYRCCLKGFRDFSNAAIKHRTQNEFSNLRNIENDLILEINEITDDGLYIVDLKTKDRSSLSGYLTTLNKDENDENVSVQTLYQKSPDVMIQSLMEESPEKNGDDSDIRNSTVIGAGVPVKACRDIFNNVSKSSSSSSSGVSSTNDDDAVRVTEVTTARDFTIQRMSDVKKYEQFSKLVEKEAMIAKNETDFLEGNMCIAYSSLQSKWTRVKILDVSQSNQQDILVVVKSIDDGTKFCVTKRDDLKKLSLQLYKFDPFSIRCGLPIDFDKRAEETLSKMMFISPENEYKFHTIATFGEITFVELYKDMGNVIENYIQQGYCKRIYVAPKGEATVIEVQSVENFIVRMRDSDAIMQCINQSAENCIWNIDFVKDVKKNVLYFSKWKENVWARARVTSTCSGGNNEFNSYFIDHGQTRITKHFQAIEIPEVLSFPPQAIKCSLAHIPDTADLEKANKIFNRFLKDKRNMVKIEMIAPGVNSAKVDIDIDGKSLCEKLFGCTAINCEILVDDINDDDDDPWEK